MADEKKKLAEDKEIAEGLEFNDLKEAAKALNAVLDNYNALCEDDDDKIKKARVVGAKKLVVFQAWRDGMDALIDLEFEDIPQASVELYMKIYPDDAAASAEEEVEPSEEVEPAEEPKEEVEPAEEPEPKKEPTKKDKGNLGSSSPSPLKNFADLKARLENPQSPTGHFDRICLEGGTLEQMLATFLKFLKDSGIEFKSINTKHSAKAHIQYRIDRGYVYEEEDDKIKLVGYEKS